jgi:hypothetical protein
VTATTTSMGVGMAVRDEQPPPTTEYCPVCWGTGRLYRAPVAAATT